MAANPRPYVSSGLIALGGVVVLALYTGNNWLDPLTPMIIGAAAAFPLSIAGALLLHPEARSAPSRFLLYAVAVMVGGIVSVGVPGLWKLPQARVRAVQAPRRLVNLAAALDDPSPAVAQAACRRMLAVDKDPDKISDELETRPQLANACLHSAPKSAQRETVAASLMRRWHRRLMAKKGPPTGDMCVYSEQLAKLPADLGARQARLMACALQSDSPDKRICCVNSLATIAGSCDDLADHIDADQLVRGGIAGLVLALAYKTSTVVHDHAMLAKKVDLSCSKMQMVSVQLACVSHNAGKGSKVDTVLKWLLDKNSQCLTADDRKLESGLGDVCSALMDTVAKKGSLKGDAICQTQKTLVDEHRAELAQLHGLSKEESSALAGQIAQGNARANDRNDSYEMLVNSMMGKAGAPTLDSYTQADKRKIMERMRATAMSPQEMMKTSFGSLKNVQEKFNKIAANPKTAAALQDMPNAPSSLELGDKGEDAMGRLDKIQKRLDGEAKAAKARQDVRKKKQGAKIHH